MYVVTDKTREGVFPLETFIKLLDKFQYLSKNELVFIFGVLSSKEYIKAEKAVALFREKYNSLKNKNIDKDVKAAIKDTWNTFFHRIEDTKLFNSVRRDYTDAFCRALLFTELFYVHGKGFASKVRVTDLNKPKFEMLINNFTFQGPPTKKNSSGETVYVASRDDIEWFGNLNNITLPWDNEEERRRLLRSKIISAQEEFRATPEPDISDEEFSKFENELDTATNVRLKDIEKIIDDSILLVREEEFIQKTSKTKEARIDILDKFDDILNNTDEAALWLEVNTWKALTALHGNDKKIIHNFKMNFDLTPKSFAPGVGNTPDMEVYFKEKILLPEVSLMRGTKQWEHEGSSVISHVLRKIEENPQKDVLGLFITSSVFERSMWQFFILNRESWIGVPVPVVPITINQFSDIINHFYKNELGISDFYNLICEMSIATKDLHDFTKWSEKIQDIIDNTIG